MLLFEDELSRWQAVLERNPLAEGVFFYGVKTTGIFCRPTCASRRPKQQNICFFNESEQALRAGYIACRRCCPVGQSLEEQHREAVEKACRLLEQAEEAPGLEQLAAEVGFSGPHFQRVFKKHLGVSPAEYLLAQKARRLSDNLASGMAVSDSVFAAGYGSGSRVYEQTNALLGMTPARYRAGGQGETIRYGTTTCELGLLLAAVTDRGICAVSLGDSEAELTAALTRRFFSARVIRDPEGINQTLSQIVRSLSQPDLAGSLPLDIRGTAFQHRVWQALRQIPAGSTLSYSELASRLGSPDSTRAVARACAANELALLIPCHRIIRQDGGPGGYRWGLARKEELLGREREYKKEKARTT